MDDIQLYLEIGLFGAIFVALAVICIFSSDDCDVD